MTDTQAYYDNHAATFFDQTVNVDMTALQERFLANVRPGGLILDAGCGSGRDAKAFQVRGFQVKAFDASPRLARLAAEYLGQPVEVSTFAGIVECDCYDGIWACASLLHLPLAEIPAALDRLWKALKPGGAFYLSFKMGEGERAQDGRQFTDASETNLCEWLRALPQLHAIETWLTDDQRPDR